MSIVKSLLLGSAAGLVAVASAQAADLPAKSKAVEYVKVCDAYGAGFYYIPGTDVCLKVGGYVRADYYAGMNNGATAPIFPSANTIQSLANNGLGNVSYDRADDLTSFRSRAAVDLDARTRTEYGTLRSYGRFYVQYNSTRTTGSTASWPNDGGSNNSADMDRAFIQFAGFTFGYVQSFFDFSGGLGTYTIANVGSNKLTNVFAYTASLGNGLSLTIAAEDASYRRNAIQAGAVVFSGSGSPGFGSITGTFGSGISYTDPTNYQGGQALPDIVANIRVDQSWGSAQLSGAVHQLRADDAGITWLADQNDTDYGYAIGAGVTFNLDSLAKGDQFVVQGSYTSGATEYTGVSASQQSGGRSALGIIRGTTGAIVDLADAYISEDGSIEKVDAWTIRADFRHFWTPSLRSTIFGGYTAVEVPAVWLANGTYTNGAGGTPDNSTARDFNIWQIGFNTTWSPVRNLDIGVELLYTKLDVGGQFGSTKAFYLNDEDVFSGMLRVQRNF